MSAEFMVPLILTDLEGLEERKNENCLVYKFDWVNFFMIGFTKIGNSNSHNLFLISGLTIQSIAVVMYYISKFKGDRA